jgi:hypothetical protein
MRRIAGVTLSLGLALAVGVPVSAQAQRTTSRTVVVRTSGKKGPKYCQTGEGHPKFGPQWCIDHGFALGTVAEWERTSGLGLVTVQVPGRRAVTVVTEPQLTTLLGNRAWARLQADAHRMGYNSALTGRWLFDRRGTPTLRITSGSDPVAELRFDQNGRMEHAAYWH